jgi:hypothetical protein
LIKIADPGILRNPIKSEIFNIDVSRKKVPCMAWELSLQIEKAIAIE